MRIFNKRWDQPLRKDNPPLKLGECDNIKLMNKDGIVRWQHPGGKLREMGAHTLTDAELLAILISIGIKGKTAEDLADELLGRFGGKLEGLAGQPLENFLEIKGLSDVKIIRIAAAFELARRVSLRNYAKKE